MCWKNIPIVLHNVLRNVLGVLRNDPGVLRNDPDVLRNVQVCYAISWACCTMARGVAQFPLCIAQ